MGRALAATLVALLLLPLAQAHIDHPPPRIQTFQLGRAIEIDLNGTRATADLLLAADPMRHLVRHVVDPAAGLVSVEYRANPGDSRGAFRMTIEIERLLEYRDVSGNLQFDPSQDVLVRSWPFDAGAWRVGGVVEGFVGSVGVETVTWNGTMGAGPRVDLVLSVAGIVLTDEGARGLPQDAFLYLDIRDLPPRGTGHLYTLEGRVRFQPSDVQARAHLAPQNVTTSLYGATDNRVAFLQWGGEAIVDGREQTLEGTVGEPDAEGWQTFRLNFPLMDHGARLVMISGVEYLTPNARTPTPELFLVVLVVALAALSRKIR